jgi:MarR family transcriptional regulator, transcriptional regulator for hemolysin
VTTLVDRLERAGWVERRPHPADRRLTVVTLSHGAEDAAAALGVGAYEAAVERAAAGLTASQREAVAEFLGAVAAAAAEETKRLRAARTRAQDA